ncbi:type II toxin-antitoxin system PemK/MazF family toxin [Hellea balneolensis]|uniref:type II toxin-antitoxin system PemK/MazF family toxin n=1 Tax=Hellea balneolensis TaxID=287478 RepID=UPI000A02215F
MPHAQKPEFIGRHPAIILSIKNDPKWPHLVVPLTSSPQDLSEPTIVPIEKKFIPTGKPSYAICSHIYSVAHSRLSRPKYKMRLTHDKFELIKIACCIRLPFSPMQIS